MVNVSIEAQSLIKNEIFVRRNPLQLNTAGTADMDLAFHISLFLTLDDQTGLFGGFLGHNFMKNRSIKLHICFLESFRVAGKKVWLNPYQPISSLWFFDHKFLKTHLKELSLDLLESLLLNYTIVRENFHINLEKKGNN